MIGKIKGTLVEREGNVALIETSTGIFYEAYVTNQCIASIIPPAQVELYTFLNVREDALTLFAFETKQEYKMFKMLLDVPGVGPKSAFSIVSFSKNDELITAVKKQDSTFLTRIPGLGKKTALKILLELSSKLNTEFHLEPTAQSEEDQTVIDALMSLGFKSTDITKILPKIADLPSVEEKITEGIRHLSNSR
ncbi:MAG: Holliday junction branch migration protein RuvA [Weeksellaceae bacterium]